RSSAPTRLSSSRSANSIAAPAGKRARRAASSEESSAIWATSACTPAMLSGFAQPDSENIVHICPACGHTAAEGSRWTRLLGVRMSSDAPDPRRWIALILLCATQFMLIIDVSIVNVALPTIERDLHFTNSSLQWVASAYALTFGGFLLLGGRCADLLGRRRL